ncbi:cytochrome c oxidase subunit II [Cellulosimicrobium sp. NPDC057127]|uniref:cytochrome c oxidase subunit II n=1 Tax=Cellulosimicrobium sp. NPDC057127 TaxID=3346026 RepID=UPI00362B6709
MRTTPRSRAASAARLLALAGTAAALLAGCSGSGGQQSALSPSGAEAERVDSHWQLMLVVGSVVWVLVVVALLVAVLRRGREDGEDGRRGHLVVAFAGAVVPALVIVAVFADSVLVLRDTADDGAKAETVVEVTGHQYWWEIRYPGHDVVTANEVHVPVGETVRVELTSADVIHSLWVPELSGKVDLVPGSTNVMTLHATEPGTYWGQCAEYCGVQHAWMRFVVVAHDEEEFDGWVAAQARPAEGGLPLAEDDPAADADPTGDPTAADAELVARGREVFMSSSCVYCHTIAGTEARGTLGPDLTHLASRQTLGAGVLANDTGNLAAWILDPQSVKPGNAMPGTDMDGDDLQALLAYLESLE